MSTSNKQEEPTGDHLQMPDDLVPGQTSYVAELIRGDVKATLHFYGQPREIYTLHATFDKVASFGTLGHRQVERAKIVLAELLQLFHEALLSHGWQQVAREELQALGLSDRSERWRHVGLLSVDVERQLTALAARIWHGPYPRQDTNKIAPVDLFQRLPFILPYGYWHAVGDALEIAIRTSDCTIHVRRRRITEGRNPQRGTEQESQTLSVLDGAYSRTIKTKLWKFRCAWCEQIVEQHCWPGRRPRYCSPVCAESAERERTRARVQRLRERRKQPPSEEAPERE